MNPSKWDDSELEELKNYIIMKKPFLRASMYRNIYAGKIKFRKPNGFFTEMGNILDRSAQSCKSKFQKFEKQIYTEYLGIPREHYNVLVWIRRLHKKGKGGRRRSK